MNKINQQCIVCGAVVMAPILLCAYNSDREIMTYLVCGDSCQEVFIINPLVYESKGQLADDYVLKLYRSYLKESPA